MKNENKLKYEKYIMNISLIGSVLFMIAEGVVAFLDEITFYFDGLYL